MVSARRLIAIVLFVLLVAGPRAWAAAPATCLITGVVYNADGSVDANDTITIQPYPTIQIVQGSSVTAQPQTATTDANGNISISLIQGLTVNVATHNGAAGQISTFVPVQGAASWGAFISATQLLTSGLSPPCVTNTVSASPYTLNTATSTCQSLILAISPTITVANLTANQAVTVYTVENSSGGWVPTFVAPAGDTLVWPTSEQPSFPSTAPNVAARWSFQLIGTAIYGNLISTTTAPLSGTIDFNNYSGVNIGGLNLQQLPPPSSLTATATCSGTCTTTYTYEVTCLNDTGQETLPSLQVTATNASALSGSNNNVLNWSSQTGCYGGYNVYGRTSGSLALMATTSAITFTDSGQTIPGGSTYTILFDQAAYPSVAVWDLRNALAFPTPIDVHNNQAGKGTAATATGLTTAGNNETDIPVFGFLGAATFTPPGGFSNAVSLAATNTAAGLWGGTQNIATAGAVSAASGTISTAEIWGAVNLAVFPASTATPITVVNTTNAPASSPYTSVTFQDPTGATSGDLEIVCVTASAENAQIIFQPASFTLIDTATYQNIAPQRTTLKPIKCFYNNVTGVSPPTANSTGIITQATNGLVYKEAVIGLQTWTAGTFGGPGSGGNPQGSISYPVAMTITSCRVSWVPYTCTTFPTFALVDSSNGNAVLCSSGTVTGTATDGPVTPSSYSLPANHVMELLATTTGSCTGGGASMSVVLHQ